MTTADVIERMNAQLVQLGNLDFGYPLGENIVRPTGRPNGLPPDFLSIPGARWLAELYSACDGLSFPDIHVGYFVKPLSRLRSFDRSSEPDTVAMDGNIGVLPFGSTGGGSLFVVEREHGAVMLLPPGPLREGTYDGKSTMVKVVAKTVPVFLELLLAEVGAFVRDDKEHKHLSAV